MWSDFNHFFTCALSDKLQKRQRKDSLYLKCVATLLCKENVLFILQQLFRIKTMEKLLFRPTVNI